MRRVRGPKFKKKEICSKQMISKNMKTWIVDQNFMNGLHEVCKFWVIVINVYFPQI